MDSLSKYIQEGVEKRGYRYVFDARLDEVWPLGGAADRTQQMAQIQSFAAEHGWRVTFTRDGRIAIFRRSKAASAKIPARQRVVEGSSPADTIQ